MSESVFIVDDDEYFLKTYRRVLRKEPYTCHLFSSPLEALEAARRLEPAVVVSDQKMPGMKGTELLRKIKKHLPITTRVIVTGAADMDTAIHSINKGHVFRFIKKPWDDHELKVEIREALEFYKMNQRLHLLSEFNMDTRTIEMERFQGVLEMAGAVCHEFAQPLQAISGYCSMMMDEDGLEMRSDPRYLSCINEEVKKLGELLFKVMSIGSYKTKGYLNDHRIIDLDAASEGAIPAEMFRQFGSGLSTTEDSRSREGREDERQP